VPASLIACVYGVPSDVVKFSVWPNMSNNPDEVLDTARWAEQSGWHGIWYADHYMPNTGTEEVQHGQVFECWAMLPAIAAFTDRIRIGSLVAPTSVHHPAVLANRAATIDHLSNGRMVLGIGAGWQINEHRAYGIELEPPGARVTRFDEAIQIIRRMLADERTTFDGSVYTVTDAPADPSPVQTPLPILVGTGGARMLRITARHADEWNTWGAPHMAGEAHKRFDAACLDVGRDTESMWTSVQALLLLTDDDDAADAARKSAFGERMIAGSAEYIIDQIGTYIDAGFDEFIVPDFNLGASPERRRESLEHIDDMVVSQFV